MTTSIGGTTGITFPDASTQSNSQVGMKNRIIDGGFTINQRVYVSGTSLASGTYGHDRWKGGASAGTYTFTQGALGVNTTITITAGSIIQVIEGCNLPEGGTYVLSWTGTAQGRLNGGTYGSSGTVTVTGWTAGTNLNVEFNTGTCGNVQLEKGSTATSFDYRPFGTEFNLCLRYFEQSVPYGTVVSNGPTTTSIAGNSYQIFPVVYWGSTVASRPTMRFIVPKRATPTIVQYGNSAGNVVFLTSGPTAPAVASTYYSNINLYLQAVDSTCFTANNQATVDTVWGVAGAWTASAEL